MEAVSSGATENFKHHRVTNSLSSVCVQSYDDDSKIKVADFGLAKKVPRKGLKTFCGSPSYVAPEIIKRLPYNTQCDVWSLGVIAYILLGGYSPFGEASDSALFKQIETASYEFHPQFWDGVSNDAKDFIDALLNSDPRKRLTCAQALSHRWMVASGDVLAAQSLVGTQQKLQNFNAKRKFRAAVKSLIAVNRIACF